MNGLHAAEGEFKLTWRSLYQQLVGPDAEIVLLAVLCHAACVAHLDGAWLCVSADDLLVRRKFLGSLHIRTGSDVCPLLAVNISSSLSFY